MLILKNSVNVLSSMSTYKVGVWWFILHCVLVAILQSITKYLLNYLQIFEIIFIQTLLATIFLIPFVFSKLKMQVKGK